MSPPVRTNLRAWHSRWVQRPWTLDYSDGAGNHCRVEGDAGQGARLSYDPVQPRFSSSGVYSGGEALEGVELSPEALRELLACVERAREQGRPHSGGRAMGTGLLAWRSADGEGSVLLEREQARELDAWLARQRS